MQPRECWLPKKPAELSLEEQWHLDSEEGAGRGRLPTLPHLDFQRLLTLQVLLSGWADLVDAARPLCLNPFPCSVNIQPHTWVAANVTSSLPSSYSSPTNCPAPLCCPPWATLILSWPTQLRAPSPLRSCCPQGLVPWKGREGTLLEATPAHTSTPPTGKAWTPFTRCHAALLSATQVCGGVTGL